MSVETPPLLPPTAAMEEAAISTKPVPPKPPTEEAASTDSEEAESVAELVESPPLTASMPSEDAEAPAPAPEPSVEEAVSPPMPDEAVEAIALRVAAKMSDKLESRVDALLESMTLAVQAIQACELELKTHLVDGMETAITAATQAASNTTLNLYAHTEHELRKKMETTIKAHCVASAEATQQALLHRLDRVHTEITHIQTTLYNRDIPKISTPYGLVPDVTQMEPRCDTKAVPPKLYSVRRDNSA